MLLFKNLHRALKATVPESSVNPLLYNLYCCFLISLCYHHKLFSHDGPHCQVNAFSSPPPPLPNRARTLQWCLVVSVLCPSALLPHLACSSFFAIGPHSCLPLLVLLSGFSIAPSHFPCYFHISSLSLFHLLPLVFSTLVFAPLLSFSLPFMFYLP